MTDYEPWAGTNYHTALRMEPLSKDRNRLKWLVYEGDICIAAFLSKERAKRFAKSRTRTVKEIEPFTPIPD